MGPSLSPLRAERERTSVTRAAVLGRVAAVGEIPGVAGLQPIGRPGGGAPAETRQPRDIHQLARCAVGLAAVIDKAARISDDMCNRLRQFADRQILAGTDIDVVVAAVMLQ